MVCTGHHGSTFMPHYPDQDKFEGIIKHTHSLKHGKDFEDKTVVVVGTGNSGGDAAIELSINCKQVYLSTRRGTWVTKRVGPYGWPFDAFFHRRILLKILKFLPKSIGSSIIENLLSFNMDHHWYQLRPKHRFFSQHVMINDALPNRIISGRVIVKSDIERFTRDGVIFKGETTVTKCDAIIMATGYKIVFPFISESLVPVTNNSIRLYKFEFVPSLGHTLAFIGLIQPIGSIFPIAELQARWFSLLMVGKVKLPTETKMLEEIETRLKIMKKRYYNSNRHTIQVDFVDFMDELAKEIGANPPILKYLFTDPRLFWTLMFHPSASYQYRLVGPNNWSGAREAQINTVSRIRGALNTNVDYSEPSNNDRKSQQTFFSLLIKFALIFILFAIILKLIFFLQKS
ncbi:hypothetical protein NH340_JMT06781 [Sarcoptes scabiei]|nr:hypothetical protein NH340_JMT06781 [Sarcoptes scabiei]